MWYQSMRSSEPEFCIVGLWETLATGWASLWEASSFVPWFVPSAFRDGSGVDPEWPWNSRFSRNSSCQVGKEHIKRDFPSYRTPETVSFSLCPRFLQRLEWYYLLVIWVHFCFVPGCSSAVPHTSLCQGLQIFAQFSELPFDTGKTELITICWK